MRTTEGPLNSRQKPGACPCILDDSDTEKNMVESRKSTSKPFARFILWMDKVLRQWVGGLSQESGFIHLNGCLGARRGFCNCPRFGVSVVFMPSVSARFQGPWALSTSRDCRRRKRSQKSQVRSTKGLVSTLGESFWGGLQGP